MAAPRKYPDNGSFSWQPPNLLWPADHAWFVATEIDSDSTLIGGAKDFINDILSTPGLEAWPVKPTDSVAADADDINPTNPHALPPPKPAGPWARTASDRDYDDPHGLTPTSRRQGLQGVSKTSGSAPIEIGLMAVTAPDP